MRDKRSATTRWAVAASVSCSGPHGSSINRTCREFGGKFLLRRADRLLWGTDWYDLQQKDFLQFELFDHFDLPEEVVQKIAHGNARRLFRLKPP